MKAVWTFVGAFVAAMLVATAASANTVTFGFEAEAGPPQVSGTSNFLIDHFVFSPACHYDVVPNNGRPEQGDWIGFDMAGCYEQNGGTSIGYNHNYLGPDGPVLWQARLFVAQEFGELFTLESFLMVNTDEFGSTNMIVRSSKGGYVSLYGDQYTKSTFSGDQWTDVAWLEFDSMGGGLPRGIDDLVLSGNAIPEPGTLCLGAAAALAALAVRRRRVEAEAQSTSGTC